MNGVPEDIVVAFNSLIESRGGASKFDDFTLDVALAAVTMMADLRDASRPASDRVKPAEAVSRLLGQLPAIPARDERRAYDRSGNLSDLTLMQLSINFERCMAGDPDAIWIDRRG